MFADLNARIRSHADRHPSRLALTFGPEESRISLTYGELVERTEAMARTIARRTDPGERVLLLFPAVPEFAVSFLGCLLADVIAVPVPVPADEAALRRVVNVARDCSISLVVSMSSIHEFAASGVPQLRQLCQAYDWLLADTVDDGADVPGQPRRLARPSAERIAFLQYTSGSTASPRGVMVSHGSLMANEAAIAEAFGVQPDSVVVSWLPLHHDMGLIGGLLQPLYTGARSVILEPWSFVKRPASWLETVSRERADISGGPNFAYELCVRKVSDEDLAGLDLSSWRVAFNGAAQVFPRTLRAFSERFSAAGFRATSHLPCYGLAEATLLVAGSASRPAVVRGFSATALESGRVVGGSDGDSGARELVAYPMPAHASVRVIDPATTTAVPDGRVGEIVVSGDSNGSGYWGDPPRSAETFELTLADEPGRRYLRTGDLGFVLDKELYVQGRSKDLIIYRGRNLHPEDIEADLSRCDPDVRAGCCAVFAVPGEDDENIVVCQEVRASTRPERFPDIADRIRRALSRIHGADAHTVLLVPPGTVPKTSSGKVQRQATSQLFRATQLPVRYADTGSSRSQPPGTLMSRVVAPGGGSWPTDPAARADLVADVLCAHLQDVLRLPARPNADESFVSLGMDSIQAAQLQHEIEEALGVTLRPTVLLRATSIRELARTAAEQVPESDRLRTRTLPGGEGYALTTAQRSLWFVQRAEPDSIAYNVTRAFRLTGQLDHDAFAAALNAVVRRHPSLQLNVLTVDGHPKGVVRRERDVSVECVDARSWTADQEAGWLRTLATTPFDLEHDPLVRCALLCRPEDCLLVLSLHHIVCDLSSLEILVDELAAEYAGGPPRSGSDEITANEPGVSPAALESAALAERGDDLTAFWRQELAGELPVLALPPAGPPPEAEPVGSLTLQMSEPLTSALTRFARTAGLTSHNLLLAAFQVLLHRFCGQSDVLVGVPVSTRPRALADWVGYQVNVVPVRSAYRPDTAFRDFARATQRRVLDVMEHQDLPLAEITRLANPDRLAPTTAVFQAMFSYYSAPSGPRQSAAAVVMGDPDHALPMGSCILYGQPIPDFTVQSQLCLNVTPRTGAFVIQLQYDTSKVSRELVERLGASYLTLVESVAADPSAELRRFALVTGEERHALVAAGTGPRVPRPAGYLDVFEQMVERIPGALAADDGETRLTYAELDERSNHVAAVLRTHGVGVDAGVLICAQRSVDYLIALLGIHKADGCYVPISPAQAPRHVGQAAARIGPVVAIGDQRGRELLAGALPSTSAPPEVFYLPQLTAGRSTQRLPRLGPAQGAAYIMQTSGSTGTPKLVVATNAGMHNHLWQMVERLDLGPEDCVAQTSPVTVDLAIWQFLSPLLVGGWVRVIPEPGSLSVRHLLAQVSTGGISVMELMPAAISALLDAGLGSSPGALRAMIATGDPLTADLPTRWRREAPTVALYNAYGATECSDDVSIALSASGPDHPASLSIGRPLANSSMLVLDDDLNPVPAGVTGSVYVGGIGVTRGYLGDARRTATSFVPDLWSDVPGARLYRTGDRGRLTPSGEVDYLGRADDQVKIRGLQVVPLEVEAALRACPGVTEAAVKVHDGPAGAILVGYLARPGRRAGAEPDAGQVLGPDEDRQLRGVLADRLPPHMVPTVFVSVPQLPRTATNKIDYRALTYTGLVSSPEDDADGLDDPVAAAVRKIWADTLGVATVASSDGFFQLGGHSMVAVGMIDNVRQALGVEVDVSTVFTYPRLCEFVEAVRQAQRSPGSGVPSEPAVPGAPVPASTAQQRFWFLREVDPGKSTYNMPGVLHLRGPLDEDVLEAAVRDTLERHAVLLARFSLDAGQLYWTGGSAEEFVLPRLDLRGAVAEFGDVVFDQIAAEEAERPADLRNEFPFRATLARLALEDWRLVVTIDHIACDGWSLAVFLDELASAYNQRVRGASPPKPEIRHTFADYCRAERAYLGNVDRNELKALWPMPAGERFSLSPLPSRAPAAPNTGVPVAGRYAQLIDDELGELIRATARQTGTTPFMVFATALSCLTHQGSAGRETILLGTLVAQRDRPEWHRVVGPLLNVSILMVELALGDAAGEALQRVRDAVLRVHRTSSIPYQEVAAQFPAAPGGDGSPFEVMLVMQPETAQVPRFEGLTADLVESAAGEAPYPLTLDIEPHGDGYRMSYRYASDRYAQPDVEELAVRLHRLIHLICQSPARPISDLVAPVVAASPGRD